MNSLLLRQWLTSIALLLLLSNCGRESIPGGPPQLLKLAIDGVPQEDIHIDETNQTIEVLLPSTLPSLQFTPAFQLTKGATVLNMPIDLGTYCPCRGEVSETGKFRIPLLVQKDDFRVVYQLSFSPKLPLKLLASVQPIEIQANLDPSPEHQLNLFLPAENYISSARIRAISVAKVGQDPNWIGGTDACFNICPTFLNQIGISLYGYRGSGALTPGEYEVQLQLADGSAVLKYPQIILIK